MMCGDMDLGDLHLDLWAVTTQHKEPAMLTAATQLLDRLKERGIRATLDNGADRIQAKIKVAADLKIPYLAVVGPRDQESQSVSVRAFGIEENLGALGIDEFVDAVADESETRGATRLLDRFEGRST